MDTFYTLIHCNSANPTKLEVLFLNWRIRGPRREHAAKIGRCLRGTAELRRMLELLGPYFREAHGDKKFREAFDIHL